ncbi:hypothetical protein EWB00_007954 [Schistosoma japonicum]|uniref:Uncharacterized protein n=1 Tax=Schistosoma japonicum TaxID=6182 RepID=A0A4Z2CS74_SCHJA|nr:hypothetical protein EWB00_007954 [Schistosoma japonicum]TNN07076.1 hypothetical protein EWB00_007954 [Schistosoma japonicum]TNN07077.1 hypothetical protein EWB00_007954 [Schistosoma japonicum]TNN07078.1 hypothetical protein EWB00_007954 [Schistosoma japonicum]
MADCRDKVFKFPRRKTVFVASRYLEKPNSLHRSTSCAKGKSSSGQYSSLSAKRQSSPKSGINASNAHLIIDDSVASAIHSHDDIGQSSSTEHSSGVRKESTISSDSLPLVNPLKLLKELDADSLSDISLAAFGIWTLFQRCASFCIVNKIEYDYVKISGMLDRIKSTREEIIRLRKAKCYWENWFQSIKYLHNERNILSDLIQMLNISESNSQGKDKQSDNSLDNQNSNKTEFLPQLEQIIVQKFVPVLNRLTLREVNLDGCENLSHDLKELSDIASLFYNISEDDLNSFEQLADEIHQFADSLQNIIYPRYITQYKQFMQCIQTFILQTSLKCEQIGRELIKKLCL